MRNGLQRPTLSTARLTRGVEQGGHGARPIPQRAEHEVADAPAVHAGRVSRPDQRADGRAGERHGLDPEVVERLEHHDVG
jgi:hypothetical protein